MEIIHFKDLFGPFSLSKQGAEAKIYVGTFLGKSALLKLRFKKQYRHPQLDEIITKKRLLAESRALSKCRQLGIRVPAVYFVDVDNRFIILENLQPGETLKEYIDTNPIDQVTPLLKETGKILAKIHQAGLVHGDLTTSNFIIMPEGVYIIDFGLCETNVTAEDKAVDLYVMEKVFLCAHLNCEQMFPIILKAYKDNYNKAGEVLHKLDIVRTRGRKRLMVG